MKKRKKKKEGTRKEREREREKEQVENHHQIEESLPLLIDLPEFVTPRANTK